MEVENSGNIVHSAWFTKVKQTVINGISEEKFAEIMASFKSGVLEKLGATEKDVLGAVNQNAAAERLILTKIFEAVIDQRDDGKQIVKKFVELQKDIDKKNEITDSLSADIKALGCRADELIGKLEGLAGRYEWLAEESIPRSLLETNEFELNEGFKRLKKADFTGARWHFGAAIKNTLSDLTVKAKGYFGLALAKNKVHLVWDYAYDKCIPICYRKVAFDNAEYNSALSALDRGALDTDNSGLRSAIINFWDRVAEVQDRFEIFQKQGYDFDCFICTKISPLPSEKPATTYNHEDKSVDWKWIYDNQIYARLNKAHIKTFYSEVDCKKYKKGTADYNAYISYALSKAKVMLLVCGKKEYLDTPWVQNEYKRFLSYLKIHKKSGSKIVIVFDGEVVELPGYSYTNFDRSADINDIIKRLHEEIVEWAKIPSGVVHCQNPICGKYFRKEENYGECPFCGGELLDTPRVVRDFAPAYSEMAIADADPSPSGLLTQNYSDFIIENNVIEMYTGTGDAVVIPDGVKGIKSDALAGHLFKRVKIPSSLGHISPKAFSGCRNLIEITFTGTLVQWNNIGKGDGWDVGTGAYTVICTDGKSYKKGFGGSLRKFKDKKAEKAEINKRKREEKEQRKEEKRQEKETVKLRKREIRENKKRKRRSARESTDWDDVCTGVACGAAGIGGLAAFFAIESLFFLCDSMCDGYIYLPEKIAVIVLSSIAAVSLLVLLILSIVKKGIFDEYPFWVWIAIILFVVAGFSIYAMFGLSVVAMVHRDFNITKPIYIAAVVLYGSALIEAGIACILSKKCEGLYVGLMFSSIVAGIMLIPLIVMFSITKYKMPEGTKYEENGINYSLLADDTFAVSGTVYSYKKEAETVTIPKRVKGKKVTRISHSAFAYCRSLKSISIPDSVTTIEYNAFYDCSGLTSITIPDSVTTIEYNAFYDCSGLTSITIPDSVTTIGSGVFNGCSNLKSITLPASVASISSSTFAYCRSLTNITIPESVISIERYAFSNCSALTSIDIPDGVTSIDSYAFEKCSSLTSIDIPDSVTSIDSYAFVGCDSLQYNDIDNAFYLGNAKNKQVVLIDVKNTDITVFSVSENTKIIYDAAFEDCSRLTSIDIPDSVTSIGQRTFDNCSSLTSIDIPDSVTSIGSHTFYGCSALTSVEIPEGVTSIGSYAFSNCSALTSIDIPDGVTSIGFGAFIYCKKLTSVSIPDSVTTISSCLFFGCSSLTNLNIPDSIMTMGSDVFYGCNSLQYNDIDNALYLGNAKNKQLVLIDAKNTDITAFSVSENAKIIYDSAFKNCGALTSIEIPDGVISIGSSAFSNCSALTSIDIPASVTSIGSDAFTSCKMLNEIVFQGTEEQWNRIKKGTDWDKDAGDYTVKFVVPQPADSD